MAMVNISRFDILLISLDPSQGAEIKKTRPCIVISPDEMNKHIRTIIIAPMTSSIRTYPTRINVNFDGKMANIVLDQIRVIDRSRIVKNLGRLDDNTSETVLNILNKMFSR